MRAVRTQPIPYTSPSPVRVLHGRGTKAFFLIHKAELLGPAIEQGGDWVYKWRRVIIAHHPSSMLS